MVKFSRITGYNNSQKRKTFFNFNGNDLSFLKNINISDQIQSEIKNNKKNKRNL